MTIFFYGEDTYRLRQKLNELKAKFISSSLGDTNLVILDGKTATYEEIVRQILALPFLSRKRLVIIEGLLKNAKKETQEKTAQFLTKIPETTVLVMVEENIPDRRTGLFKKLCRLAKCQEFKLLEGEPLRRWIKNRVAERGGEIESEVVFKLVEYVGQDLWRMSNEIDKLTAYSKRLTAQNIELLVVSQTQSNIFALQDALAAKNPRLGVRELLKLIRAGMAELYILTMIVAGFRNLLIIKDELLRTPQVSRWQLAKTSGLHPFVVAKNMGLAHQYSIDELKKIYETLLDFDSRIKIGKIEPKTALELLVFKISK